MRPRFPDRRPRHPSRIGRAPGRGPEARDDGEGCDQTWRELSGRRPPDPSGQRPRRSRRFDPAGGGRKMMTENEIKKIFLDKEAMLEGHFQLTSGRHSDTYL